MARRNGYIFTNRRHSDKAIMATILGVISLVSLGCVIFLSYTKSGSVPVSYGLTGLLAALFSLIGLILGIVTVREKERYHFFSWLGIVLNFLALALVSLILNMGVRLA